MTTADNQRPLSGALLGRSFVHPVFDYMLIGGGLSLVVTLVVVARQSPSMIAPSVLPVFLLIFNSAHFSASTVRLYTKPGAYRSLPFLTMAFPLITMVVLTVCIHFPDKMGPFITKLYLTWSPYHYAAQAYGLAVMYAYRSGCLLGATDKRLLWWVSMLAFFHTFLDGEDIGLRWLMSAEQIRSQSWLPDTLTVANTALKYLAFCAPPVLFVKIWWGKSGPMPFISMLTIVTNGVWFFVLSPFDAFVWATIFHSVQYIAIVVIFHLKDQMALDGNRHGPLYHVAGFYAKCVGLGYGLFMCVPWAFQLVGYGPVESALLVVAVINVHHFVVDQYIWRLKKTDGNRTIVDSQSPAQADVAVTGGAGV